ncbi:hypothetical protein I2I05_10180 [Hymenobacter sp. BT683]|uniref:Phospholipase/carboxylesterase/thioesterase domain-containing protein n=1 Tax=Hymenobacter jeongseonensis TaxID=2791027 RepID=A0ABS0IHE4_9BACT|nr:alpha/beta hydrolase-fold protein [Hymenobacter jeongseonensis]MBF9237761.1 hypothetical protein [Hymenobacter jeongseonensis]
MKSLYLSFMTYALLLGNADIARAQTTAFTYEQLMEQGGAQLQAQNPCEAVATFQHAFAPDSTRANEFELFGAATAAAKCPARRALAWRWLGQLSRHRPLRMTAQDLDNVSQDPALASLKTEAAWPRWVAAMRRALAEQEAAVRAAQVRWRRETQARALSTPTSQGRKRTRWATAQPGLALYFSSVPNDTVRMPYLVRVPAGYSPARPAPVVVYLHGGVANTSQFGHNDPEVVNEPIFAAAPPNALVVYPFGRQTFGWVDQPAAFAQIEAIVREVQARYRTAPRGPVLGGMSNGGSAALWFASQRPDSFSGFYALSPAPNLPLGASIGRLGQGKTCLQFSAQDDTLYPYSAVQAFYAANQRQTPEWKLQTVPTGGHSFLYGPDGIMILQQALTRLLTKL